MSKIPPLNVQFELAMLWRTLSVLKSIDVPSVVLFYEKLIPSIKNMSELSLSTYWKKNSLVDMHSGSGDMHISMKEGKSSEVNMATSLLNINELDYLRHEETIDSNHDPLQVMKNLYSTAAMLILHNLSSTTSSRDILLSACLNMAVKSGRISLLLHFILMILSLHESYTDIDIDISSIQDINNFFQAMENNGQNHLKDIKYSNKSNNSNNNNSKLSIPKSSTLSSSSSSSSSHEAIHDDPLTVLDDPLTNLKSTTISTLSKHTTTDSADHVTAVQTRNGRRSGMKSNGILLSFGKADHGKNK